MYDSSAVTAADVAVSTVRSCAAAPAGADSAASRAAALASEPNVFRCGPLDTMVAVQEWNGLAHLQNPRAGAVPDVLPKQLRSAHVGRDEQRAPVLVAPVDNGV